jgi:two-component system chemotaxis response regulator CheB
VNPAGLSRVPRVVVADDSTLMRRFLADALASRGFDVVATAEDGDAALQACAVNQPDVMTLDLAMPGLDGIGVLKALRALRSPVRVVVVSGFSPAHGARAVDALAEGAVELVPKPSAGEPLDAFFDELEGKVRAAASSSATGPARTARAAFASGGARRAVVIASSTGGPRALAELVPALPAPLGHGTMIVQHMPAGFTASLADRLDRVSSLDVREAEEGAEITAGVALVAPGGKHLRLNSGRRVHLTEEDPIGGLRPRADLTIADAAKTFRDKLLLVVLTGMGRDGEEGARVVKQYGGKVLAEAESTCTVYGMPRAIVEANLADEVLPLHDLPSAIAREAGA